MHSCVYAYTIGRPVYFIEREDGVEVCGFCHSPKNEQAQKAPAKPVRK